MSMGAVFTYLSMSGLAVVVAVVFLAYRRGFFRNMEAPKYEMLEAPPAAMRRPGPAWQNQGAEDRIIRFSLGVVCFYFAFARLGVPSVLGLILPLAGTYLATTGAAGFDPAYALFRVDTRLPEHRPRL